MILSPLTHLAGIARNAVLFGLATGLAAAAPVQAAAGSGIGAAATLPQPRLAVQNPFESVTDLLACTRSTGTMISAHRAGAAPGFPENSLHTAAHALSQHPVLFEIDVRASKDGTLVLHHDATLERTTTGTGPIAEMEWSALSQLYLKDNDGKVTPYRMTTLADMLGWSRDKALVLVEVKVSDTLPAVIQQIRASNAHKNTMLLVNSLDDAKRAFALDPSLAITTEIANADSLAAFKAHGLDMARVLPWAGVAPRNKAYWQLLKDNDLTVSYGTFWYIDTAVEYLGLKNIYAELAQDGVDLMATDHYARVAPEINTVRPIEPALQRCGALAINNRAEPS